MPLSLSVSGLHYIEHSSYCDVLMGHLLLPMTEAALKLPEGGQTCFLYLMSIVFWSEYRKTITLNKRLYS
jgi:hypothetical protein